MDTFANIFCPMRQRSAQPLKGACLHGFASAPTISVPKLQKTSSCLLLTLLMFATARVSGKKYTLLEVSI